MLLLAQMDNPGVIEALKYLNGFLLVMLTLGALWGVTVLLGSFFTRKKPKHEAFKAARVENEDEAEQRRQAIATAAAIAAITSNPHVKVPPHLVAVITASIHSVLHGRKHRIVSIRPSQSHWSAEGRRQIFASHRVR